MKKNLKRALALILMLLMLVNCMPSIAVSEGDGEGEAYEPQTEQVPEAPADEGEAAPDEGDAEAPAEGDAEVPAEGDAEIPDEEDKELPEEDPENPEIGGIQMIKDFGNLTALYRTENHGERTAWLCRCVCGNEVAVTTHDLRAGKTKSCGCRSYANPAYRDLTGMQIGRLCVLSKTDKRDYKGSIYWRCRCSCGIICLYSADSLIYGHVVSCGCYRKEVISANIAYQPHRVDGTCVERLLSTKARPDSKSGYVGIHIRKRCAQGK